MSGARIGLPPIIPFIVPNSRRQQPIHHGRHRRPFACRESPNSPRQVQLLIAQARQIRARFAVAIQTPSFEAERLFQFARGFLAERTARSQQRREMLFGDACLYRRRRQRLEFIQHPPQVRLAYLSDIHVITIKKEFTLSTAYFKLPDWRNRQWNHVMTDFDALMTRLKMMYDAGQTDTREFAELRRRALAAATPEFKAKLIEAMVREGLVPPPGRLH